MTKDLSVFLGDEFESNKLAISRIDDLNFFMINLVKFSFKSSHLLLITMN